MLYLVATPIGDPDEITLRALKILKESPTIICESTKEASRLLKHHGITGKKYEVLDEHSDAKDIAALYELCKNQDVALVTDCGTPGFADPGAKLVAMCRNNKVPVKSILGASSLMGLLSLTSQRFDQFYFRGFVSAESEQRTKDWLELKKEPRAMVIMDTPYRFKKTLADLGEHFPKRQILVAANLSTPEEMIYEGTADYLHQIIPAEKAEFMILIYPPKYPQGPA